MFIMNEEIGNLSREIEIIKKVLSLKFRIKKDSILHKNSLDELNSRWK